MYVMVHHSVLIETYWNVKDDPKMDKKIQEASINRNILKCKE